MKSLKILLTAAVFVAAGVLFAEAPTSRPAGEKNCDKKCVRQGKGGPIKGLWDAIGATDEQKEKLKPIFKAHHEKMTVFRKENRDKVREATKAMHTAAGVEEFQAASDQLKVIFEKRLALHKEFETQLGTVLSAEQVAKAKAYFKEQIARVKGPDRKGRGEGRGPGDNMRKRQGPGGQGRRVGPFQDLKLTDEQKQKIKDIMNDARAKSENLTGDDCHKVMREAREKISDQVLTEEQRSKLRKKMRQFARRHSGERMGNPLKGIATDEQMEKIKAIMSDAREKAEDADPEARRDILQAARKKVSDEVLTEEQRDKLREKMKQMRQRRRVGDGERRRPRRGRGEDDGAGPDDEGEMAPPPPPPGDEALDDDGTDDIE